MALLIGVNGYGSNGDGIHAIVSPEDGISYDWPQPAVFMEALRRNPRLSRAYHNLAMVIAETTRVPMPTLPPGYAAEDHPLAGRTASRHELFGEAIRLDPAYVEAYEHLANIMGSGQTVTMEVVNTRRRRPGETGPGTPDVVEEVEFVKLGAAELRQKAAALRTSAAATSTSAAAATGEAAVAT